MEAIDRALIVMLASLRCVSGSESFPNANLSAISGDKMQVSSLFPTTQKSPSAPASPNTKAPGLPFWAQEGGRVEAQKCQNQAARGLFLWSYVGTKAACLDPGAMLRWPTVAHVGRKGAYVGSKR